MYVQVKFSEDYNTVLSTPALEHAFESYILTEYANLYPDVLLSLGSIEEGTAPLREIFFTKF